MRFTGSQTARPRQVSTACFLCIVMAAAASAYLLSLGAILTTDDPSRYVVLGQSIARGWGYRYAYLPGQPLHTLSPPGFPALLALVWLVAPEFPANLVGFQLVSVLFTVLTIPVAYWLLVETEQLSRREAGVLVLVAALNPLTILFAARFVGSEATYGFFSLAALLLLTRVTRDPRGRWWGLLGAAVAATAAYLTRTVGIALAIAGVGSLLVSRRPRRAAVFLALFGLLIAPWAIRNALAGSSPLIGDYTSDFWAREYGRPSAGQIGVADLVVRVTGNAWAHSTRLLPGLIAPTLRGDNLLRFLGDAGLGWLPGAIGIGLCLVIVVGWAARARAGPGAMELYVPVYMGIVLLPPWHEVRNLVPLLFPALFYLVLGTREVAGFVGRWFRWRWLQGDKVAMSLLLLLLASSLVSDRHLVGDRQERAGLLAGERELAEMAALVRSEATEGDLLMFAFPEKLWLYAAVPTVPVPPEADAETTLRALERAGVTYLVLEPGRVRNEYDHRCEEQVVERYPERFERVYGTPGSDRYVVYRVLVQGDGGPNE